MFCPIAVDVPMQRWPIANWVLIAFTCFVSIAVLIDGEPSEKWMLIGPGEYFSLAGLFGSLFIHLDILHLLGNMVFLFVFGNAINAKIGHFWFLLSYLAIGAVEGLLWAALADGPAAGASGAIMGMMGMFIVLYPRNEITVFYWLFIAAWGTIEISVYILIVIYFIFDLWGVVSGGGNVAYLAHVAGFVAGFGLGASLVLTRLVESDADEQHLFEVLGLRRTD